MVSNSYVSLKNAKCLLISAAYRESDVATEVPTDQEADSNPKPSYFSTDLQVRTDFINNIYASFQCVPTQELCSK